MPMTAIVLAAGEGNSHEVPPPPRSCTSSSIAPLVSWVTRAAREAGAERIVVVVGHGADEVRGSSRKREGRRVRRADGAPGHRARRARGARGGADRRGPRRHPERRPAAHRARDRPRLRGLRRERDARRRHPHDDAARPVWLRPRRARRGRHGSRASSSRRTARTSRPRRSPSATPAATPSTAPFSPPTSARSATTTPSASTTSPTWWRSCAAHGHATTIVHCEDYREGLGANNRAQLAELTRLAQERINERPDGRGRHDSRPAHGLGGPRRQRRARHGPAPHDDALGRDERGRGVRDRPQHASHQLHRRRPTSRSRRPWALM